MIRISITLTPNDESQLQAYHICKNKDKSEQKEKQTSADDDYTLSNMIVKYCTHNKVGINILNVWDMTYYQFMKMFLEYRMGRQADINDMMAANSFSFKNSKDYKPMEYMNKIK